MVFNRLRYWLYRTRFRLREYLPFGSYLHLDLELSAACNLSCIMCPYGEGTFDISKQGMMPVGMARRALKQARAAGALSVKLNFRGEPGLSQHLISLVKEAKTLGYVEVIINTNLTAFSKRRLRDLCDAGLDLLIVSVDGATKETYEKIRVNADFDKLKQNLEYVWGLPSRPRVRIQMTVQDTNRHEVELMGQVFGSWSWGPLCDELNFNPVRSDNSGERKRCPQPFQRIVVLWTGQVLACCSGWGVTPETQTGEDTVIGQFPEQSLTEIWKSRARKELLYFARNPTRGGPCKGCLVGGSYK
jgi:MoaA/NifB/PqqE/SkfB family radical SAM enzyme